MAARIQRKSCGWQSSWTQRLTRQFFSWTIFIAYASEKCGFGLTQCLYSLPHGPKLRDLAEDQNHKGPVQKTHWRSRTSSRKCWWFDNSRSLSFSVKVVNLETLIDMQSWCRTWATQWIQSYPCKNKTSQETQRSLPKFLEPERKPKVIYTDNSLEFGKAREDLSWNHCTSTPWNLCTSTPHRSETNGSAERVVRRVKEGTSAVLLQPSLDKEW